MYMKLCPEGSEGASYSMLTTFSNIAVVCSYNLGTMLSKIWWAIYFVVLCYLSVIMNLV
jgi:predicted MFS family arabinose efflux permease